MSAAVDDTVDRTRARTCVPRRLLAAVILPIGPAAVGDTPVRPSVHDRGLRGRRQLVAAHQTAQSAVVWLGFIASLTLAPAVIFACHRSGGVAATGRGRGTLMVLGLPLAGMADHR